MFNEAFASSSHLPLQGTEIAAQWDSLYIFLLWLSAFFFVLIMAAMIYFAITYRSGLKKRTKYITGSHLVEAIWTVIPTILLMIIFGWGYVVYNRMTQAPTDAYEIRVIAKQWLWQFQYDDGRVTIGELYVPVNKPVRLIMTSQDVIHSFFVPNFRVKQDVVPGMYTSVWFEATMPGKHQVFCTEYCGTSHSEMLATTIVLEPAEWEKWKKGGKIDVASLPSAGIGGMAVEVGAHEVSAGMSGLAAEGKKLAGAKGCIACHSDDGTTKVGPSWKGIFGGKEELADGSSVVVDENYLRESIEQPNAKVTKGFNPVMPPYKGLIAETEMNAIIAYIKSLK